MRRDRIGLRRRRLLDGILDIAVRLLDGLGILNREGESRGVYVSLVVTRGDLRRGTFGSSPVMYFLEPKVSQKTQQHAE